MNDASSAAPTVSSLRRFLWRCLGAPILRATPYPAYRLRALLLQAFGARLGRGVRWRRTARVDAPWSMELGSQSMVGDRTWFAGDGPIRVGPRTTVSQGTMVLSEVLVAGSPSGATRGAVEIGADAWVAADVMVLPGVAIGSGSVVGSRSVVVESLGEFTVAVGHPARVVARRRLTASG